MLKYKTKKVIEVHDWDNLVTETYGRPYSFQQQDGCKSRGVHHLIVPVEIDEDFYPDSIPEVINGSEMGVSFKAWLARDPKQPVGNRADKWTIDLFWQRNFYPDIDILAADLHAKGLIEAGEYTINIDW
jgi:hypothetical protein